MGKVFLKSIMAALGIEILGTAANLISYSVNGRFLLAKQLMGGEWMGWVGFGLMLNRTFPMSSPEHPALGSSWISFDLNSLLFTLLAGFVLSFFIILILHLIKKNR